MVPYDGMDWVIGRGWAVVPDAASVAVAARLVSGTTLLGCEDSFPSLAVEDDTWTGPAVLLTVDAEVPDGWVLDHPQGYAITWAEDPARIEVNGKTEQGLHYGVLALLQSLEFERDCDWPFHPPPSVTWSPTEVLDRPDVALRMGFASFKGDQNSNFLPNIVHAGLGRCEDPSDTALFWKRTLDCDVDANPRCAQVHRRLDTLVAGRFTHALDEGHPFQVGSAIEEETGCDGTVLYDDIRTWLADRQVTLVPTAFGLESRTPNTPIGGSRVPEEDPAETWGDDGDISLSEGLGVSRDMQVCAVDDRLFLAPDCDALDDQGRVTGPLESARVDVENTLAGERSVQCDPLEICEVKPDCWLPVQTNRGLALKPSAACSNPALRVTMPVDATPDRLYALSFLAQIPEPRDLVVKVITRGPQLVTPAQDVYSFDTDEGEYLDLDEGWERFTVLFRTPSPQDEDWKQAFVQLLGVPGSGLRLDDLVVEEVDGRLAAVDPSSVEDPCLTVDVGWEPPLRPAPYRAVDGTMALPLASIEVDPSCASEGEVWPLSYRTFAPAGLWPNVLVRQKVWTWTPDTLNADFWEHPMGPEQQLAGAEGEHILVSDLGGEVRGLARDGTWPVDERLADFMCRVLDRDACPTDAMCDCSGWSPEQALLLAGDMYTPLHNGARGHAQVPFAGFVGDSWTARRRLPDNTLFLSWWHYDALRIGVPVGGHEMMLGMVEDFATDGLRVVGASAWDPDNQRAWAAAAAGDWTAGTAHYGWGTDEQATAVMLQAGRTAWAPGVALEQRWAQTPTETATSTGMALEDHTLAWPLEGTWQRIHDANATWTVAAEGDWVRFYVDLPEGCQVTAGGVDVAHTARWEVLGVAFEDEVTLTFTDCVGGVLDEVATYRTLARVNYPAIADEGLEQWASEDAGDPRTKVCGDPQVWECVGASWPPHL